MQKELVIRDCPICGHDNRDTPRLPVSREHWELKECKACHFVYLENPPSTDSLKEDFAWEKTFEQEAVRRRETSPVKSQVSHLFKVAKNKYFPRKKLRKLIEQHSEPGKVLDVGCGWGGTLLANLPEGYTPFGLEVSKELAEHARAAYKPLGGDVVFADAKQSFSELEDASFDAVTLIAILEHVMDPIEMLSETTRVLRPGAPAIVKVPNYATLNRRVSGAEWCGFRFPDHVNYFSPASLVECGRRAGLTVARFQFLDRQQTSDNMWCVFQKPIASAKAA